MPARPIEPFGDQVAADKIHAFPPRLTAAAHDADRRRVRSEDSTSRRTRHATQHPEFAQPNLRAVVLWVFVIAMVFTAGAWDVLTFRPVGVYLASVFADGTLWISALLQIVFPLMALTAELYVSTQRADAGRRSAATRLAWNAAAVLIVLVMPLLTMAAQLADDRVRDTIFWMRVGAMALLTALLHVCVAFGGEAIDTAKGWLFYRVRDLHLLRVIRDDGADSRRRAGELFRDYHGALEQYNAGPAGRRIPPAPLDEITRRVLRDVYGYEVQQVPTATGGTNVLPVTNPMPPVPPPPQGPQPEAAPAPTPPPPAVVPNAGGGTGDGEAEYLRRILEQRVRDADSRVSPPMHQ